VCSHLPAEIERAAGYVAIRASNPMRWRQLQRTHAGSSVSAVCDFDSTIPHKLDIEQSVQIEGISQFASAQKPLHAIVS